LDRANFAGCARCDRVRAGHHPSRETSVYVTAEKSPRKMDGRGYDPTDPQTRGITALLNRAPRPLQRRAS
jgi:hypothetical protein